MAYSFTADLIELEGGGIYGACFSYVTERNRKREHFQYTAADCRKRCRELGGDLPTIRSAKLQDYLAEKYEPEAHLWLGIMQSYETGNWTWLAE